MNLIKSLKHRKSDEKIAMMRSYFMFLLSAVLSITMTACNEDEPKNKDHDSKLCYEWVELASDDMGDFYRFSSDGTGMYGIYNSADDRVIEVYNFVWYSEDDIYVYINGIKCFYSCSGTSLEIEMVGKTKYFERKDYTGSTGGSTTSGVPSSIINKFLHLYRSDGQTIVIEHLNSSAGLIANQDFISYIDGYAPEYSYKRTSNGTATYYLMWTPSANSLLGGIRHFLEVTLTFDAGEKWRGSFTGTTWIEGWNYTTFEPYRKNEVACNGRFYLGGEVDSGNQSGSETDEPEDKPGVVNKIEISAISDVTSTSALIEGSIDIDGGYTEAGFVCVGFENSLEAYAFATLSTDVETFKREYSAYCTKTGAVNFMIKKSGLKSKTYYGVKAYAIIGDKLVTSESKSFTTK